MFWDCSYPPLVAIRDSPEFHDIVSMDKSGWPRCLLWHGWLPALSGADDGVPWAVDADHVVGKRLEVALGSFVEVGREPDVEFSLVTMMPHLLMLLMSGLMVVLFSMVFRELALPGVVSTLVVLVLLGLAGGGGILIYFLLCLMVLVRLAGFIVLFLALCRQYSGLRSGVSWLLCRVSLVCMLVWIISMWFVM